MKALHSHHRRRSAIAIAGIAALGSIGFVGCGSSSSDDAEGTASTAAAATTGATALSEELQGAYVTAEDAITEAENTFIKADDISAANAAWPALETELNSYEQVLEDMEAGASGKCLDAVTAYVAIEAKERELLEAAYAATNTGPDSEAFYSAVRDYTAYVETADVKNTDALLADTCIERAE